MAQSTPIHSRPKNIRHRFQRDLIIVITLVCVITLGTAAYLILGVKKNLSAELISRTSEKAIKELQNVFTPLRKDLSYTRQWGMSGHIDPTGDMHPLMRQFIPMLQENSFISAMIIANSKGQEYMLLRDEGGWLTRSTDKKKYRDEVLWKLWSSSGELLKEWTENSDYDPRQRPWFKGALSMGSDGEIFWTEPYSFYTRNEPGITASISWRSKNNEETVFVAGFDILLVDISEIFTALSVSENGMAVLVEKEKAVLAPFVIPLNTLGKNTTQHENPAQKTAINAVNIWHGQTEVETPFRFSGPGQNWWSGFKPIDPDTRDFWVGVVVPESDFTSASSKRVYLIIAVTLSILGLALLLSYLLVRKYGQRLKDRPIHSLDEGKLDDSIRALIDQGESDSLEFKSTMRRNLKSGKFGKEVELAWLKTVVAFLNTNGGTLLIGVDDNGTIQGLGADGFDNDDKCRLHFKNLISQHIGLEFSEFIDFDLKSTEGKTIGVVHCSRANAPVFLKHGRDEDFFIRSGPASLKLSVSQVLKYLKQR